MTIALVSGPEEAAQAGFVNFVDVSEFVKADTVLQDSLSLVSAEYRNRFGRTKRIHCEHRGAGGSGSTIHGGD